MSSKTGRSFFEFVEVDDKILVQRPSSWVAGFGRYNWIKSNMHKESHVCSPCYWETLIQAHKTRSVYLEEDGSFVVH